MATHQGAATRAGELDSDVCVVGAGPVGLSIAHALGRAGVRVIVVESGTDAGDADAQRLNDGEVPGDAYCELRLTRHRAIGGSAHLWSTEIDGAMMAKYVPLDEIDFEERDAVPFGGWPFRRAALEPYYRAAHELIGLGTFDYGPIDVHHQDPGSRDRRRISGPLPSGAPRPHPLGGGAFVNRLYRFGSREQFTVELPTALAAMSNVMTVRGATVTEPEWRPAGAGLRALRWRNGNGATGAIRADRYVLAAGGIENARLLLLWTRPGTGGPPPAEWLGRGFMEHPVDSSLELTTDVDALCPSLGFYAPHDDGRRRLGIMGRLGLSAETLRALDLPNASVRIVPIDDVAPPPPGRLRAAAARVIPRGPLHRGLARAARALRPAPPKAAGPIRYRVLVDLEQPPHRDNRIVLSSHNDVLGQPRAALHWRWRDRDESGRERLIALIADELERSGFGTVRRDPSRAIDPNVHHHAGATRMHPDPKLGVVDENLRVHGVENLFVAGSSVFPTAGFANPTLTSVALALRLADHLVED